MFIDRDKALESSDLKHEDVKVPEWGGTVRVRELTARERDAYERGLASDSGALNMDNFRARLCVLCMVDADGARIFNDDDAPLLGGKSAQVITRVYEVAQRLNGLGGAQGAAMEKNSGAGQTGDSNSA